MPRLNKEDYQKIYEKYQINRTWSFSQVEAFKNDKYEYFLKYIKKIKGDLNDSIYGILGGEVHNILEQYYNDEIQQEEMLPKYQEKFLELDLFGKKFDRTSEKSNEKIKASYNACLEHFFKNHYKPNCKVKTEMPITYELEKGFVFIGYIDLVSIEREKLIITDFKTSTIYSAKDMESKTDQLMLYAEAIRSNSNLSNFNQIQIQYNFLKYVEVSYIQLNGKEKVRNIERNQIGSKLASAVKIFLKADKQYNDIEIMNYLDIVEKENSINCLPSEIKNKFIIKDCIVKVPIDNEIIKNFKEKTIETLKEIIQREDEYNKTNDDKVFWEEITDNKSYYFANLSEYSYKLHLPYQEYVTNRNIFTKKEDKEIEIEKSLNPLNQKNTLDDKWSSFFGD